MNAPALRNHSGMLPVPSPYPGLSRQDVPPAPITAEEPVTGTETGRPRKIRRRSTQRELLQSDEPTLP
jgi:hypothetical protein